MNEDRDELDKKYLLFEKAMKNKKTFKELGFGLYATVYQKTGSNEVIKMFGYDDGYLEYLKLIANHKNQKAFPRIDSYHKLTKPPFDGLHLVKMEALNRITDDDFSNNKQIQRILKYFTNQAALRVGSSSLNYLEVAARLIKTTADNNKNLKIDFHKGNIMKRSNDEFVITDPFITRR